MLEKKIPFNKSFQIIIAEYIKYLEMASNCKLGPIN